MQALPFPTMTIRIIVSYFFFVFFVNKRKLKLAAKRALSGVAAASRKLTSERVCATGRASSPSLASPSTARLVQSEWCVDCWFRLQPCVSFPKRQGKSRKSCKVIALIPSQKKPGLKQIEQEKNNTIHGCFRGFSFELLKCGGSFKVTCVSCHLLDVELGVKPFSFLILRPCFPPGVLPAAVDLQPIANPSDAIRKAKTPESQSP
jgi:hypothetical protein